jgi:N-acetylglucosamine kinase-like BadF-type ATPase
LETIPLSLRNLKELKNGEKILNWSRWGGTKTISALANLEGKILVFGKSGPSNIRKVGSKIAVENIAKAIKKVLRKTEKSGILSTFIG